MSENTVTSEEAKVSEKATKETKKAAPFKPSKGLIIGLSSLLVIIVLIVVAIFVRLGNQTVLARGLDAVGQHKLALSADYIGAKGLNPSMASLVTLDMSNPEDCKTAWSTISNVSIKDLIKQLGVDDYTKQSSISKYSIRPATNDFKDKFIFDGYITLISNTSDNGVSALFNSSVTLDADTLNKIAQENGATSALDFGLSTLSGKAQMIVKGQNTYINLPDLQLKTKNFNLGGGLNNWYKSEMPASTTNTDKEKYNQAISKLLDKKLNEALSDDTGKAVYSYFCSGIQSYTIGSPVSMEFGTGEMAKKKDVRPVTMVLKPDFMDIYLKGLPDVVEKISQDAKLKPFLKANYETFLEIAKSSGTTDNPTKEEFEKSVDDMFKDFNKSEMQKSLDQFLTQSKDSFKLEPAPIKMYLDLDNLQSYASDLEVKVLLTDKVLSSLNSPEITKILKDGIVLKLTTYDVKYGSKAEKIEVPANAKDISELPADFGQTPVGQKVQEELNKQNPPSSDRIDPYQSGDGSLGDPNEIPGSTQTMPSEGYTLPENSTMPSDADLLNQ